MCENRFSSVTLSQRFFKHRMDYFFHHHTNCLLLVHRTALQYHWTLYNISTVLLYSFITLPFFPWFIPLPYRWRFTDFTHSMMYAFIIMCGSYIEPLRQCVTQAGDEYYVCIISLTPLFIIGNLIVSILYQVVSFLLFI